MFLKEAFHNGLYVYIIRDNNSVSGIKSFFSPKISFSKNTYTVQNY